MGHFEELRKKSDAKLDPLIAKTSEKIRRDQETAKREQAQREEEAKVADAERDAQLWRDLGIDPNAEPTQKEALTHAEWWEREQEYERRMDKARLDEADFRIRQEEMDPKEAIAEMNKRHEEREAGERQEGPAEYYHVVDPPPPSQKRYGFRRGRK